MKKLSKSDIAKNRRHRRDELRRLEACAAVDAKRVFTYWDHLHDEFMAAGDYGGAVECLTLAAAAAFTTDWVMRRLQCRLQIEDINKQKRATLRAARKAKG